jgi:hypothetical protein
MEDEQSMRLKIFITTGKYDAIVFPPYLCNTIYKYDENVIFILLKFVNVSHKRCMKTF